MLGSLKFDAVIQLAGTEDLAVALFVGVAGGSATAPSSGGLHNLVGLGTRQK